MSEGKALRELLFERAQNPSSVDAGLSEKIEYQAICTVRWCLLFHGRKAVTVGVAGSSGEMYALDLDEGAVDEALNWLPAAVIVHDGSAGAPQVRLADLDDYLDGRR